MSEPRLRDPAGPTELLEQREHLVGKLRIHERREPSHHAPQQDATESRGMVDGEVGVAERHASGGSDRSREIDLQLCDDHFATLPR